LSDTASLSPAADAVEFLFPPFSIPSDGRSFSSVALPMLAKLSPASLFKSVMDYWGHFLLLDSPKHESFAPSDPFSL